MVVNALRSRRGDRSIFGSVKCRIGLCEDDVIAEGAVLGTADWDTEFESYNKGLLVRPSCLTGPAVRTGSPSGFAKEKGKFRIQEREYLMKTPIKSKRCCSALLLSMLCAGVVATFLGGCAEGPYVTAYDTGYYPTAYYTTYGYPYSYYYGPTYDGTIVRSGVRYYDAYGPRTVYGDWY